MFAKPIESFLEAFDKKFQPPKWGFVRIFQPDFELHFFKISTFFTFPKGSSINHVTPKSRLTLPS
eukprot:UN15126